jgi:tetratricopeptide (TPR) repeat protein/transcriptional regulator with XRE-family HTH domain
VTEQGSGGPVADFCAELRRLQQDCGLTRAELARRVHYSRSQLYEILDGRISRPPDWRLVERLVRACTGDNECAVAAWRRRHDVLVEVCHTLRHQDGLKSRPKQAEATRVVPAQLPADVELFTGRAQELADLDRLLAGTTHKTGAVDGRSTAVVISAVSGTAGVGKTALAVHWAHRVRDEFPDGQLYVNLRGYDPSQPMSTGDALAGFLRALGMAGQNIPLDVEERAAAYRSLLNGRRMLVLLDNAATAEQVRLLLPGTPSCLVVVTSRDCLAGLVARHGARRLDLDLLPAPDAIALLGALIGERVEVEPEAAARLAGQCARLPLALRVAAELVATYPASSLAVLVSELADEQRRLELLNAGGDPRTAVSAVFSWSYQHLSTNAKQAFRLLGLHPGPNIDPYAAAALINTSLDRAQHLLDLLAQAHLIQPVSFGRYGMHDLLRAYAIHLASVEDSEKEKRASLTRLFDHYLSTAAAAMDTLVPAEHHYRPHIHPSATPSPPVTDLAGARAWLDAERPALSVACAYTAAHGWPRHTTRLAAILFRYLEGSGHYPDALTIHTHAWRAARDIGDRADEAHALTNLGVVFWRLGHYRQAADHLQQALALCREVGDRAGEANALTHLGNVHRMQGCYRQAADHLQ